NLLSGQLFVALDFYKGSPKAAIRWDQTPPALPTIPGSLANIEQQVQDMMKSATDLLKKFEALPLDRLSDDASTAMRSLDSTLKNLDRQLADDSTVQQDLRDTLRELSKAAAEARTLIEYLTQHPDALIKGKAKEE
ncbi:MAG: paraquat-inducible protein, partial [Pseudomonadota bacterium]|nr:paraquat-inducible protein [Pseudomonadota bacterium]